MSERIVRRGDRYFKRPNLWFGKVWVKDFTDGKVYHLASCDKDGTYFWSLDEKKGRCADKKEMSVALRKFKENQGSRRFWVEYTWYHKSVPLPSNIHEPTWQPNLI